MKKILAFALALAMILTCSLALADRLDDIKAAGKLTVATSPDWPPYEYIDDDGNIVGTDILMCQWMAEQLGVELEIHAYYRYSFNSHWRIEPSIYVLTEKDSSVDINFDAHYVFQIADWWGVFPQVGIVANDIKDWAVGMSVGAGFDFNVAHRWNISAGLKYEPMFDSDRSNPLVVYVGAAYRF